MENFKAPEIEVRGERLELEEKLPEYIKMYEISGHGPITRHDLERYERCKKQDEIIAKYADNILNNLPNRLDWVGREQIVKAVRDGLKSSDFEEQKKAALALFWTIGSDERRELIVLGLKTPFIEVLQEVVNNIGGYDTEEVVLAGMAIDRLKPEMIKTVLESGSVGEKLVAAKLVTWMECHGQHDSRVIRELKETIDKNAREILESPQVKEHYKALEMIWCGLNPKSIETIKLCLASPDIEVQSDAIFNMGYNDYGEDEEYSLRKMIVERIREDLYGATFDELETISDFMLDEVPSEDREALREEIVHAQNAILGEAKHSADTPLYRDENFKDVDLARTPFQKTGSETTLLGGKLKNKIIIRHIAPEAFLLWQRLYEDYELWRREGFDYVPIEPIQAYRFNRKDKMVEVASGVLDLNLYEWAYERKSKFAKELLFEADKIEHILEKLNIRHGHVHYGNFCLRFFRGKNGKPNLNRKPRVYLIDFDQAVSPGKPKKKAEWGRAESTCG